MEAFPMKWNQATVQAATGADAATYKQAVKMYLRGAVLTLRGTREGRISATTAAGSAVIAQSIAMVDGTGGLEMRGTCECGARAACAHVVAVAIGALIAERDDNVAGPVAVPPPKPTMPGIAGLEALIPKNGREPGVSKEVEAWLDDLEAEAGATAPPQPSSPPAARPEPGGLWYRIARLRRFPWVAFEIARSREDAVDENRASRRYPAETALASRHYFQEHMMPGDAELVWGLARFQADGRDAATLLAASVASGRAIGPRGGRLAACESIPCPIEWQLDDSLRQRPRLSNPTGSEMIDLPEPWCIDEAAGLAGPADFGMPARDAMRLLAAPAIPQAAAARARAALEARFPAAISALPMVPTTPRQIKFPMVPRLLLRQIEANVPDPNAYGYAYMRNGTVRRDVECCTPQWTYDGHAFPHGVKSRKYAERDGEPVELVRDKAAESMALDALLATGATQVPDLGTGKQASDETGLAFAPGPAGGGWTGFQLDAIPCLKAAGWEIRYEPRFPSRVEKATGPVVATVREGGSGNAGPPSAIDWFDVELGTMVDGRRLNLVPALLAMIAAPSADGTWGGRRHGDGTDADSMLVDLPGGGRAALPYGEVRSFLEAMAGVFAADCGDGSALRLDAASAGALGEAADDASGMTWTGADGLRAVGQRMRDLGMPEAMRAPKAFGAELRGYQERGLGWLQSLRAAGVGGILADDMGLGKTVMTLAHVVADHSAGRMKEPALVVCPTSLVHNWAAEAARHAPSLRVVIHHGPRRAAVEGTIDGSQLVITTYPLIGIDQAVIASREWHVILADEAQNVKNPTTKAGQALRQARAVHKVCMTGTPIENHLGELWSLFDISVPGFLGGSRWFSERFRTPVEKNGDEATRAVLRRRIAPFMLRRRKADVDLDLPPKTEVEQQVTMGSQQAKAYEAIRMAAHREVRDAIEAQGLGRSRITILTAILRLRQACCDPRLLKGTGAAPGVPSAKYERLFELLPEMVGQGRRVLIFSQFAEMLGLIEDGLRERTIPYAMLTGQTADRGKEIASFQGGRVPLFLVSLKAGGSGLNLTAADTVIHYDPWWNPAVEDQATDRAHRIGQDKPVFVHRLTVAGSIEQKIGVLKERKRSLAGGVLEEGGADGALWTEEDIDDLFAPLDA